MSSDSNKFTTGVIWRFLEKCGAQGVNFIVSMILARLLSPEDYGTLATVAVWISILQVFIDGGLGNALIQKKDASDLDFSTVFICNIFFCIFVYMGMFIVAPYIATFYGNRQLISIIRVLGIMILVSALKNIQQAYIARNMLFKKFFKATLFGTVGAAFIGIYMAYKGFGVWALISQQLFNNILDTVILWLTVNWRPKLLFSYKSLKELLAYGVKMLVSEIINTVYNNIQSIVIGKKYSASELAFYSKGEQFPQLLVSNINASIDSVLFPVLARKQEDMKNIKETMKKSLQMSAYLIWPMMVGLTLCAKPIITILLTEKWLKSTVYLYAFCIIYSFYPISVANLNVIKAIGRSDIYLRLETVKKVIGIVLLCVSTPYGVNAIVIALVITAFLSAIINTIPNGKLIHYTSVQQIKELRSIIFVNLVMGIVVWGVSLINVNIYLSLMLRILVGIIVYIGISRVLCIESYMYIYNLIKSFVKKESN